MADSRRAVLMAMAALAAGAAGYALSRLLLPKSEPADAAIQTLRRLTLPDLAGKPQSLTQWNGKVLLVNFWATWCEPCREEIPALVKMQSIYAAKNLQVVGISIDSADKISDFSLKFKINYPLVIAGFEIVELLRNLGNKAGGLPFTLILDREGSVVTAHAGGFSEPELEKLLAKLLG